MSLLRDPIAFLLEAHRRHGPIFRIKALHHDHVVLPGAAANEFVHETGKHHFSARKFWQPFLTEIESPNSVVGLEGEDHVTVRGLLAPPMSVGAAERHIADFVRIVRERFETVSAGETVPFLAFAQRLVSRQVGWVLAGRTPTPTEHCPDPDRFDPDRHRPPRAEHRQPNVFAPFGRGRHACLGASFGLVQLATTLATILSRSELELPAPDRGYPVPLTPTPSLGSRFAVRLGGRRSA